MHWSMICLNYQFQATNRLKYHSDLYNAIKCEKLLKEIEKITLVTLHLEPQINVRNTLKNWNIYDFHYGPICIFHLVRHCLINQRCGTVCCFSRYHFFFFSQFEFLYALDIYYSSLHMKESKTYGQYCHCAFKIVSKQCYAWIRFRQKDHLNWSSHHRVVEQLNQMINNKRIKINSNPD